MSELSPMLIQVKELTEKAVKKLHLAKTATNGKVMGEGDFEVVATTDSVDRDGEILLKEGWDFKNYMNNPTVLWGHDWLSMPIGAVTNIDDSQPGKVIMTGQFAPTEAGQTVRKLYDSGILRTVSVGFIPKERNGPVITKMEMIELSFIPVPANPESMTTDQRKSLEMVQKMFTKKSKEKEEDTEEDKKPEEEENKEGITKPEPVETVTVTVELPRSTDNVEPQAKGEGMKVGRVLSGKTISAIQEVFDRMGDHKSGIEELMKALKTLLDSTDSEKALQHEQEKKALEENMTEAIRLANKCLSDVLRDRKKIQ